MSVEPRCFNCDHLMVKHSGQYEGWDQRTDSFVAEKQSGTGCLVEGCPCRRWFDTMTIVEATIVEPESAGHRRPA